MGKRASYKRFKLRAHDMGINRHNKGVAYESKQARLEAAHHRTVSGMRMPRKRSGSK